MIHSTSTEEPQSSTIAAATEPTTSVPATFFVENTSNDIFLGDKSGNSPIIKEQHTPPPLGEHVVTRPAEMQNGAPRTPASTTTVTTSTSAQNAVTPPRVVDAASAAAPKKRRRAPNKGWSSSAKGRKKTKRTTPSRVPARYECENDLRLARVIKVKVDRRGDPLDTSGEVTVDDGEANDASGAAPGWRWQLGKARREDEEEKRGETLASVVTRCCFRLCIALRVNSR